MWTATGNGENWLYWQEDELDAGLDNAGGLEIKGEKLFAPPSHPPRVSPALRRYRSSFFSAGRPRGRLLRSFAPRRPSPDAPASSPRSELRRAGWQCFSPQSAELNRARARTSKSYRDADCRSRPSPTRPAS